MRISETWLEDAVWGGALLGGGGGGSLEEGLSLGKAIFSAGRPDLVHPEDYPGGLVATCSVSRAPQASAPCVLPGHHVRAVELLREHLGGELGGLIPEGMGARAILDGWYPSVVLDLPLLDLSADGRGHPFDLQGMLGMTSDDSYISWQACAGGDPERGSYLEMYVSAPLEIAEKLTRRGAAQAGGEVCVARNPVSLERALGGGVAEAVRSTLELGRDYRGMLASGTETAAAWVAERLGGNLQGTGEVTSAEVGYYAGLDTLTLEIPPFRLGGAVNWLVLYREDHPVAEYPDLILLTAAGTGRPLTTYEVESGMKVHLVTVPAGQLHLGAGSTDHEMLERVERVASSLSIRRAAPL